jgi:hypothetical protein
MTPREVNYVIDGWSENQRQRQKEYIVQAWHTAGFVGLLFDKNKKFPTLEQLAAMIDEKPEPAKSPPDAPTEALLAEAKRLGLKCPGI